MKTWNPGTTSRANGASLEDCLPTRDSAILHSHNGHPNPVSDIGFPGSDNPIPDSGHSIPLNDHRLSHDGKNGTVSMFGARQGVLQALKNGAENAGRLDGGTSEP